MSSQSPMPMTDYDLYDADDFPDDDPESWLSLLRIGLIFITTCAALSALCWAIA